MCDLLLFTSVYPNQKHLSCTVTLSASPVDLVIMKIAVLLTSLAVLAGVG